MHFLSTLTLLALAAAPALAAPAVVAKRDQVYVAPESIKISAPVSNAPVIKVVPTRATPTSSMARVTLALNRDRKPLYYTSTTSTSWTTVETTTTKNIGTTTTRSTTTTKPTTVTSTTTRPAATSTKSTSTTVQPSTAVAAPVATAKKPINAAYYADWTAQQIPPENVDYSLFDVLYFCEFSPASAYSRNVMLTCSACSLCHPCR